MIDSTIEDLIDPIYNALRGLDEEQLGELAEALGRLQATVEEELGRREAGAEDDDELEEDEDYEDDPW